MDEHVEQLTKLYAQNTKQLTRSQRLALRNEIILAKIATGITKDEIQKEYQLSKTQVWSIVNQAEKEVEEWFITFPKTGMLALFRSNVIAVANEIKELTNLKLQAQGVPEKLDVSKSIIDTRIKFNRLVAEGPTYARLKELVQNAESKS